MVIFMAIKILRGIPPVATTGWGSSRLSLNPPTTIKSLELVAYSEIYPCQAHILLFDKPDVEENAAGGTKLISGFVGGDHCLILPCDLKITSLISIHGRVERVGSTSHDIWAVVDDGMGE